MNKYDNYDNESEYDQFFDPLKTFNKKEILEIIKYDNVHLFESIYKNLNSSMEYSHYVDLSIENNSFDILETLIYSQRFNINKTNAYALKESIKNGSVQCFELLYFSRKFDLNSKHNYQLLEHSIAFNQLKILNTLLNNYKIKIDYDKIQEASYYAAKYDGWEVIKKLLEEDLIDAELNDNNLLRQAFYHNAHFTVELLLSRTLATPDEKMFLCAVSQNSFPNTLMLLEDRRIEPNFDQNKLIKIAIENESDDLFNLLYNDPRINVGDYNSTVLQSAIIAGANNIIHTLMNDNFIDIHQKSDALLKYAIETGNLTIVTNIINSIQYPTYSMDRHFLLAISLKNYSIFKELFNSKHIRKDIEALNFSINAKSIDIFNDLYNHKDIIANSDSFVLSTNNEFIHAFDILIKDENINVNHQDNSALTAIKENKYMFDILLNHKEALLQSAIKNNISFTSALLKSNKLQNIELDKILYRCAENYSFDSLELLINDKRTNPFNSNLEKNILTFIAEKNNERLTKLLLEYKTTEKIDTLEAINSSMEDKDSEEVNLNIIKLLLNDNGFSTNLTTDTDFLTNLLILRWEDNDKKDIEECINIILSNKKISFPKQQISFYQKCSFILKNFDLFTLFYNDKRFEMKNNVTNILYSAIQTNNKQICAFLLNLVNKEEVDYKFLEKVQPWDILTYSKYFQISLILTQVKTHKEHLLMLLMAIILIFLMNA